MRERRGRRNARGKESSKVWSMLICQIQSIADTGSGLDLDMDSTLLISWGDSFREMR